MQRLIITGANGAGKTHTARQFSQVRPDIPLFSFDAIKLLRNWQQKPRKDIDKALSRIIAQDAWILEGGPSLFPAAFARADAVLWLDPPTTTRALRLALRPWRNLGQTRTELPDGNKDWPLQQYRFAWRSLRSSSSFRDDIAVGLDTATHQRIWHCKTPNQTKAALSEWQSNAP